MEIFDTPISVATRRAQRQVLSSKIADKTVQPIIPRMYNGRGFFPNIRPMIQMFSDKHYSWGEYYLGQRHTFDD